MFRLLTMKLYKSKKDLEELENIDLIDDKNGLILDVSKQNHKLIKENAKLIKQLKKITE